MSMATKYFKVVKWTLVEVDYKDEIYFAFAFLNLLEDAYKGSQIFYAVLGQDMTPVMVPTLVYSKDTWGALVNFDLKTMANGQLFMHLYNYKIVSKKRPDLANNEKNYVLLGQILSVLKKEYFSKPAWLMEFREEQFGYPHIHAYLDVQKGQYPYMLLAGTSVKKKGSKVFGA